METTIEKVTLLDHLFMARRVSTPLIAVSTPDPAATLRTIRGKFEDGAKTPIPVFRWDAMNGIMPLNKLATEWMKKNVNENSSEWQGMTANPGAMLGMAAAMPGEERQNPSDVTSSLVSRGTILFAMNLHRFFEDRPGIDNGPIIQGIWNLRDPFKGNRRTLIMMSPSFKFPPEIAQDVIHFDEQLPDETQLRQIIGQQAGEGGVELNDDLTNQAVDAVRGLPAFTAEQVTAMSLTRDSINVSGLWERKISVIEQLPGFSVDRGQETFDDAGSINQFKKFGVQLAQGKNAPLVYVRLDELEKSLGGIGSKGGAADNTGIAQDQLGVLLREMEDNDWVGMIFLGHAGCGKTLITKGLANTATKITGKKVLSIAYDLNASKESLVGKSEQAIRAGMKSIKGLAGKRVCFVATCNDLENLPPALRRRFRLGIWMFDLPSKADRDQIWKINLKKYDLKDADRPNDAFWTGSDIRNTCDVASRLSCSLANAAQYIVPVFKADPGAIDRLRAYADGKYLSATEEGTYQAPQATLRDRPTFNAEEGKRAARAEEV